MRRVLLLALALAAAGAAGCIQGESGGGSPGGTGQESNDGGVEQMDQDPHKETNETPAAGGEWPTVEPTVPT